MALIQQQTPHRTKKPVAVISADLLRDRGRVVDDFGSHRLIVTDTSVVLKDCRRGPTRAIQKTHGYKCVRLALIVLAALRERPWHIIPDFAALGILLMVFLFIDTALRFRGDQVLVRVDGDSVIAQGPDGDGDIKSHKFSRSWPIRVVCKWTALGPSVLVSSQQSPKRDVIVVYGSMNWDYVHRVAEAIDELLNPAERTLDQGARQGPAAQTQECLR